MKTKPILKECGCQSNELPGFGGNVSNKSMMGMSNENPDFGKIQFVPITFETPDQLREFVKEIIKKVSNRHE